MTKQGVTALLAGTLLSSLIALLPAPASADLKVCNQYGQPIAVAVAYGVFTSTGWYNVEPGKCNTVLHGDIGRGRYFIYAATPDGKKQWTGQTRDSFCIDWGHRFKYADDHICTTRTAAFRAVSAQARDSSYTFR